MKNTDRIILIHQGALGDFLMTWPGIASLRKHLPETPIYWAGTTSYLPWLKALNIPAVPRDHLREIRALYAQPETLSPWLKKSTVFWYVLGKKHFQSKHENIFFFKGIRHGCMLSPRKLYKDAMEKLGIPFAPDWLRSFQTGLPHRPDQGQTRVLIFPGSGNPAKNWPMVQFFKLALRLKARGISPCIVLGPVEQEQEIDPPRDLAVKRPRSLEELTVLLQRASCVVGNDSGPMHLAGYMGVPGLALFGPTSPMQWGPLGMEILTRSLPCSPCTQVAKITCKNPTCMQDITLDQVTARLLRLLDGQESYSPKQNRAMSYP